jgi:cystathionine beta-lyase
LLKSGDEIVAVDDIYGGAFRLFEQVYKKFGIRVTYVDASDPENIFNAITENTKLIWLESPSNPTLKIADIAAISAIVRAANCWLCVDNTFASPALQKPILLGADIVVHSATKYLGGHSDLIAGLVITASEELGEQIRFFQNAAGAILGPFDSWLVIRGMETLTLRMRQHCSSAQQIAEFLLDQPEVEQVYYPGLPGHANHIVAKRQSRGYGGIVSFTLKEDSLEAARRFVTNTELFKLAESLGGIKSLISHSAEMTHKTIPPQIRRIAGVKDSLIRLSVGLEEAEDLILDLRNSFDRINVKTNKYSHRLENC